ncbi:MAG: large-conductance mechanosensitive channel protein MscL [Gammaproteobacteria bacterium]
MNSSLLNEFKTFIVRGNMVDMAVGIIMGTAFGKIVSSLVNDIIMPPIGSLIGGVHFSELSLTLQQATAATAAVTLNYGQFIQTLVNFLIIAASVFFFVKIINQLQRQKEEVAVSPAQPSNEEILLAEIRDLLAGGGGAR